MSAERRPFRAAAASAASEAIRIRRGSIPPSCRRAGHRTPAPRKPSMWPRATSSRTIEEARGRRVVGVVLKNAARATGRLSPQRGPAARLASRRGGLRGTRQEGPDRRDPARGRPEERCSEGSLGERCDVIVRLTAQACAGGLSGAGTVATVRECIPATGRRREGPPGQGHRAAVEAAVARRAQGTVLRGRVNRCYSSPWLLAAMAHATVRLQESGSARVGSAAPSFGGWDLTGERVLTC